MVSGINIKIYTCKHYGLNNFLRGNHMFEVEQIKALNELELEVYRYVIKNKERVQYMRIRELADEVHVSTSTILRFCKKVDCDGYAEFKIMLKQFNNMYTKKEAKNDITETMDFFKKISSRQYEDMFLQLADKILEAKSVIFIGSGMSGIVAKYGARFFSSVGKFSLYVDEPHYPTRSTLFENALVIVFSVSGESRDTIGHVMRFKERNCQILSVTNSENCTLARLSDYNIPYYVTSIKIEEYDITTQLPAICIIEQLGRELSRCKEA